MDINSLRDSVNRSESETLEFKRSTAQLQRAMETLCAFLNGTGGMVFIGVKNDGEIVGQEVTDNTLQTISQHLRVFEPPAMVTITPVPIGSDNKNEVIVLSVDPTYETRPFTYRGRPYQRVGTTTSQMPQQSYEQLLLRRMHSRQRWENVEIEDIDISVLDIDVILRTIRVGKEQRRLPETISNDTEEFLDRMELRKHGKLIHAAIVLFGTEFMPDFPQCGLRMARFRGKDKREFIDNRQLRGNIFQLLEEAMLFLDRHLPIASKILPDQLERVDTPLYPRDALREALVNAFCHRDYSIYGGAVSIAIYDDRLEIISDGQLPFGLTTADLKKDHQSLLRNPIIADVLYRQGLVERWGRGTQEIVESCIKAGLPEPEFVTEGATVKVIFYPIQLIVDIITEYESELSPRQKEILDIISMHQKISVREIIDRMGTPLTKTTLRYELYKLKDLGIVRSEGHGRGAKWSIVESKR